MWFDSLLYLFFIIWLALGVITAVIDDPSRGLVVAHTLAASVFVGIVLLRFKGMRIHLWLKTHIPFWEILVFIILVMMALLPLIINDCLR